MKIISMLRDIPEVDQYLRRIKAEQRGLRTAAIIKTDTKYPTDLCVIKFLDDGTISLYSEFPDGEVMYLPTEAEKIAITAAFQGWRFPKANLITDLGATKNMPKQLQEASMEDIFIFRDTKRNIIMLQQRINPKKPGEEKRYIPWTYWEDDKWRALEPDGELLPLYGLETIGTNTTVFIHEGAKAARAVQRIVAGDDYHPWKEELSAGAHIGWIGGARAPMRSDWQRLVDLGVKRAYIVSDNDTPGVQAVGGIARALQLQCIHLQFTGEWPAGFDLADPFPKSMFVEYKEMPVYIGPAFRTLLHPATWMTDEIIGPRGRKSYVLRKHVVDEYVFVHKTRRFLHKHFPRFRKGEDEFNDYAASLAHTRNVAGLLLSKYNGQTNNIAYRPGEPSGIISDGITSSMNVYVPPDIASVAGDPKPFLEFMEYLIPRKEDRKALLKWVATLIACPKVKMMYGVLLISNTQGVGKTLLGVNILAPLVGKENTAYPSESQIVESKFNGWLAERRLVVVNEIYGGRDWKAANKLKGVITEKSIDVEEKYERTYNVENWAHFYCCSNATNALKIEASDRRWLVPRVTEEKWSREKFTAFVEWLDGAGLSIIKHWAETYEQNEGCEYAKHGEEAPQTELKLEMIEDSRPAEQAQLNCMIDHIINNELQIAILPSAISSWIDQTFKGKHFTAESELRKIAVNAGMKATARRFKRLGKPQHVLVSPALYQQYHDLVDDPEVNDRTSAMINQYLKHPQDVFPMQ